MTSSLASRLGEIPGVASVVVDLEGFGRGIDVRLEPDADEAMVMEKLRALLAAYGVRRDREPAMTVGRERDSRPTETAGVEVIITPINTGARIEVATATVKSFRIVAATPLAIAQGLSDAWCQVKGRVPLDITGVSIDEQARLTIEASDGERQITGSADVSEGWVDALTVALAEILDGDSSDLRKAAS
jgi:hypothetical protein